MTKKKIYCTKCGTKNNIADTSCVKCHESLTKKHNPLLEYMKSKVKGDLKGKVTDEVFSIVTNYIKSNLYGAILSVSILVSVTCVVVNAVIDNNEIQKVAEKPIIVNDVGYSGEGLSAIEVARKYVKAIDYNDFNTVKNLQLETFHKDVYDYIKEYNDKNAEYLFQLTTHELVDNSKVYFSYNQDINVEEPESFTKEESYGNYKSEKFLVYLTYCSYNNCEKAHSHDDHYRAALEIELINIDNNYYVLGEKLARTPMMGEDEVRLEALHRANGDTTKLSFEKDLEEYNSCYIGPLADLDIDCLHQKGFKSIPERWGF